MRAVHDRYPDTIICQRGDQGRGDFTNLHTDSLPTYDGQFIGMEDNSCVLGISMGVVAYFWTREIIFGKNRSLKREWNPAVELPPRSVWIWYMLDDRKVKHGVWPKPGVSGMRDVLVCRWIRGVREYRLRYQHRTVLTEHEEAHMAEVRERARERLARSETPSQSTCEMNRRKRKERAGACRE